MASIIYNNLPFNENDLSAHGPNFALGRFMTAWSQVESVCGFLFRALSQIHPEIAIIIFDRVGVREQIEILTELVERIPNPERQAIAVSATKEVEDISRARNKIVHAGWGTFNGEPARFWHGITDAKMTSIAMEEPKGRADRVRFVFTLTDVEALAVRAVAVRQTLESILFGTLRDAEREALSQRGRR